MLLKSTEQLFLGRPLYRCFFFIQFRQKNEIKKGNTLMELKYLLFYTSIDVFDFKDVKFQKKFDRW